MSDERREANARLRFPAVVKDNTQRPFMTIEEMRKKEKKENNLDLGIGTLL